MSTSNGIAATRRRWPKNVPSQNAINNIEQIVYSLGSDKDNIVNVLSRNIYDKNNPDPTEWTKIPSFYIVHFLQTHYRIRLYLACLKFKSDDIEATNTVKRYLVYTEQVLEAFIGETSDADAKKELTSSWRSTNFDSFLTIELYVNHHVPHRIDTYMQENDTDLVESCHINKEYWKEYSEQFEPYLLGDKFDWDVEKIKREDIENVSDFVRDWAMCTKYINCNDYLRRTYLFIFICFHIMDECYYSYEENTRLSRRNNR